MKLTKRHRKNLENFLVSLRKSLRLSKRGQLGVIEFKYFMMGLIIGIILALVAVLLGSKGVIPFKIPLVCG